MDATVLLIAVVALWATRDSWVPWVRGLFDEVA